MAVFKMSVNRKNPIFSKSSFVIHVPSMEEFVNTKTGNRVYSEYKVIANGKVFKSVWGDEWNLGMSLCIAHYLVLYARKASVSGTLGNALSGIAAQGNSDGLLTSWSVGEVSKSYDYSNTLIDDGPDSAFWNNTSFGREYYALWKQKQPFAIGVVI